MNRIITILLTSFLLNLQTNAQYINYTPGNNTFSFNSPNALPLYVPSTVTGDTSHCMAYVLEYGNGYFSVNPSNGFHYTYNNNRNYTSFLSFFPRYDTIKPPAIIQYTFNSGTALGTALANPGILLESENIRVTTIPNSMRPGEENLFIITYNLPEIYSDGKIMFYYNEDGFDFLNPVDKNSFTQNPVVKSIRTEYFGETIDEEMNTDALALQNSLKSKLRGNGYKNVLVFKVNNSVKGEKNIFITLKSKDNLPQTRAGIFEAVLIPTEDSINIQGNDTIPKAIDDTPPQDISIADLAMVSSVEMAASLNPHDPNFIEVFPKCIPKGTGTTKVHYHIHCQNDGAGKNYKLSVIVNMNPILLAGIKTSSLKVKSAGIKVESNHLSYKITDTSINLVITLKDLSNNTKVSLMDNTVPVWYCNPETMGDIDFDVDVDNRIEANLDAFATIIFHNSLEAAMPKVVTKTERLVVREKCDDYIRRYPDIVTQSCIFWGLCCWWWIVILVAVIALFWFILRRRRNRQAYDQT